VSYLGDQGGNIHEN